MRFSSDQEFFEQSNGQQKNVVQESKKKDKKQTMLSKFLDSLNEDVMSKLHNYEKLKRPIFQRRAMVPQKLTLYEDILFITVFKENQEKILSDAKQVRTICLDLQSRTKRKECTIRERVQKKLCKMCPGQLLEHVANDKDISFNLKKVLTSGAKISPQKSVNKGEVEIPETKQKISEIVTPTKTPSKQNNIKEKQSKSNEESNEKVSMKMENTPSKQSQEIFEQEECEKIEEQKKIENQQNQADSPSTEEAQDENQIFIVFKKNTAVDSFFMFNSLLIHKEIQQMKKKEQQEQQKEELMKQLKLQMEIITHFKNQSTLIPTSIQALIIEAEKIMKTLGIESLIPVQNQKQQSSNYQAQKSHQDTADKHNIESQPSSTKANQPINHEVSQFNADNEEQMPQQKSHEEKVPKYTMSYALCDNPEYIKLYNSNPQVFEALLWTFDEDGLINKLIEDFKANEKLFSLLIRYKGPEMFIERCIFLNKNLSNQDIVEAIKACKPLNLNRLNNHIANSLEQSKMMDVQNKQVENMNQMAIQC